MAFITLIGNRLALGANYIILGGEDAGIGQTVFATGIWRANTLADVFGFDPDQVAWIASGFASSWRALALSDSIGPLVRTARWIVSVASGKWHVIDDANEFGRSDVAMWGGADRATGKVEPDTIETDWTGNDASGKWGRR